jgi:hypothetical protein
VKKRIINQSEKHIFKAINSSKTDFVSVYNQLLQTGRIIGKIMTHPNPEDYTFDLERVLSSVVSLQTRIPEDAMTASVKNRHQQRIGIGKKIRIGISICKNLGISTSLI